MKIRSLLFVLTAVPYLGFTADLSGTWKSEFDSQIGRQKYTYTLKQEGDKLTGKANSEVNEQKRETQLSEAKIEGNKVSFVEMLNFDGNEIRITYKGTLTGDEMKLTREVGTFATEDIVLKRDAGGSPPAAADQRENRRGRGFGGPITLGPDDKPAFPNPPEGFDKAREGIDHGKLEMVEYDSKSVGSKRKALVYTHPVIPPTTSIRYCTCCTALAAMKTNGAAAATPKSFSTISSLKRRRCR